MLAESDDSNLDASSNGRSKRRRIKPARFDFNFLDNEEQRFLQQALKISKMDKERKEIPIPEAPVFYPTEEEFLDCVGYVRKIRDEAEKFGICKIVPPAGWVPPLLIQMDNPNLFATKLQNINTLQEGQGFDDGQSYNISDYKFMADSFYEKWVATHHPTNDTVSQEQLAKDYWTVVETNPAEKVDVEYGNDLDTTLYGSGFPPQTAQRSRMGTVSDFTDPAYYATSTWNLNNVASAPGSVLHYLKTPVNGINVPWLYVGMLFTSFCWHNEDNYFYSINYNHFGSSKQWYGVPGNAAELFEAVSKEFLMGLFRESPDLLHHMTTQISPSLLLANRVPVYKVTQEPGTFIITFPKSFHAGFSYGFNVGEAVNFATVDWIIAGGEADDRYRNFARESVFSYQRLIFTLLKNAPDIAGDLTRLYVEIDKIIQEEQNSRAYVLSQGVRDLSAMLKLRGNDFSIIDNKATDYDDMRLCCVCKSACIFSAIGCDCDREKVSCLRHYTFMCKCKNKESKFLMVWASITHMRAMKGQVEIKAEGQRK
jgi:histone demethylase JARID1